MRNITIRPFTPSDQAAVKALILDGLVEHWGELDPTLNPDLNDIAQSYAGATFLVACEGDRIVGSGALVPRSAAVAEIVRMSVAADCRRRGIASQILAHLCQAARDGGFQKIILETTATWTDVITFYRRFGFSITGYVEGEFGTDVYFELMLA